VVWRPHGEHQTAERGTKKYQESGSGCQEEEDHRALAEVSSHGARETGRKGGTEET
jgi:hypothetical protein